MHMFPSSTATVRVHSWDPPLVKSESYVFVSSEALCILVRIICYALPSSPLSTPIIFILSGFHRRKKLRLKSRLRQQLKGKKALPRSTLSSWKVKRNFSIFALESRHRSVRRVLFFSVYNVFTSCAQLNRRRNIAPRGIANIMTVTCARTIDASSPE